MAIAMTTVYRLPIPILTLLSDEQYEELLQDLDPGLKQDLYLLFILKITSFNLNDLFES